MSKVSDAVSEVEDAIDRAYSPDNMTKREALEFLKELSSGLDGKIDALEEEIDEEDEED
jgi:hypothetical protein